ncbi:MAG: aminopeptidase, partial [Sphingobacteriaceae bacterium]
MARILSFLLLLCPLFTYAQDSIAIQNGVSQNLAVYRTKVISDLHYNLTFKIPLSVTDSIPASAEIGFLLKDKTLPLQIDFKGSAAQIKQVVVNRKEIPVLYTNEHIVIAPQFLINGTNTVTLRFIAGNSSLNRNKDYLYTLLVPDRARTVFPCFDQPDLKAVFNLTLTVPNGWKTLANASVKDSVAGTDGNTTYHFLPSDRISTYLFSFVAGRFFHTKRRLNGRDFNFYYRETDSAKIKSSIAPIFDIQADAIKFMEDYTRIPYPFQKFDFAGIPDFQYGGMEHVGAIQYRADGLFLEESATKDELIDRANLLSHETAHMWFGDLVTMRWFNDVWMKEVFANLMADKIGNITFKDNREDLKFLTQHYAAAYSIDRTAGANPIRQQLDNLQDAGSLYGNIIYHKAPVMMRQLERLM